MMNFFRRSRLVGWNCSTLSVLAIMALGQGRAHADSIHTSGYVEVDPGTNSTTVLGSNSLGLSESSTGLYDRTSSASITTAPLGTQLMRLNAVNSVDLPSFQYTSDAYAATAWNDVIRLTGANPLPSALRLGLVVEGSLNAFAFNPPFSGPIAEIGLITGNGYDLSQLSLGDNAHKALSALPQYASFQESFSSMTSSRLDSFATHGFDTITPSQVSGSVAFAATLNFDIPYNASIGGYAWDLQAYLHAEGSGGTASGDFGQTIRLNSVGLTDGNTLTGFTMTFDSGLQLAAVPEPSSMVLCCFGGLLIAASRSGIPRLVARRK